MATSKVGRKPVGRREVLGTLGAFGAAMVVGWGGEERPAAMDAGALDCVVNPELTEGPFFVDEALERSDLTSGTREPSVIKGLPLLLKLGVYGVSGGSCTPLRDAQVDVWHASAQGFYSDEREKYLRGYQVADRDGAVKFTTIYPGWYAGRTVHIHFKVRTFSGPGKTALEFTSQLFMDDAITDIVLADYPYNTRGPRRVTNANDRIYRRGAAGSRLTMDLRSTAGAPGYVGTFRIGLRTS
jgi:protocatechuate 3,4-dioxygenase beta subunit